jgi:Flp pilus assembly pilin Flp
MAWLTKLRSRAFRRSEREEDGQGLFEYTLLVALIAMVAIVTITSLGQTIVTRLYTLGGSF